MSRPTSSLGQHASPSRYSQPSSPRSLVRDDPFDRDEAKEGLLPRVQELESERVSGPPARKPIPAFIIIRELSCPLRIWIMS